MELTAEEFRYELRNPVQLYSASITASIVFALMVTVLYFFCLQARVDEEHKFAGRFYAVIGSIKVAMSALIAAMGCICNTEDAGWTFYLYPLVAALVGLRWLQASYENYLMANELDHAGTSKNASKTSPSDSVYTPVSLVETV